MLNILKSLGNRFRKERAEASVVQNQESAIESRVTAPYTPVAQGSSTSATPAEGPAVGASSSVEAAPTIRDFRPEGFVVCCGNGPIIAE